MIEKIFRVTCDWCGMEAHYSLETSRENVEKKYSEDHIVYKFRNINPIADELWAKSKPLSSAVRGVQMNILRKTQKTVHIINL